MIGSGSTSFDMLRALVDRLPVMITPRWVGSRCQPIAIEDLLDYLMAALDHEPDGGEVFEIGGADRRHLPRADGRVRPAARPAPGDDPGAGADAAALEPLARPRHARARTRRVARWSRACAATRPSSDPRALEVFPIRPRTVGDAIARALRNEDRDFAETRWSDEAVAEDASFGGTPARLAPDRSALGARRCARRRPPSRRSAASADAAGWYSARTLWSLRGAARLGRRRPRAASRAPRSRRRARRRHDRLLARRGLRARPPAAPARRDEAARPRLAAARGRARRARGSTITQTALFDPDGVAGLAYWYLIWPIHRRIFASMLRGIARRERAARVAR